MKLIIIGMGYVGATMAACALKDGHEVRGVDTNPKKLELLKSGRSPVFEPQLDELLSDGIRTGRLTVHERIPRSVVEDELAIVCVGTPSLPDGSHNMSHVATVSRDIAEALKSNGRKEAALTVVYRSTMRPGTMESLVEPIMKDVLAGDASSFELVYNPEFLRESTAVRDYFSPPKIVFGTKDKKKNGNMESLYANITAPTFYVNFREAEMTKFVDNSFHATKVVFANEIGRICRSLGVSAATVHEIFVADTKLNISANYLRPGGAFGGSCLPKDLRALVKMSTEMGSSTHLLDSLMRSNDDHKRFLFNESRKDLPNGARVLLNGIAFKDNSDDLRESPLIDIAEMYQREGFDLKIVDDHVSPEALIGANLGFQLANLPTLSDLLTSSDEITGEKFDLILDARGNAKNLPVTGERIFDLSTLS